MAVRCGNPLCMAEIDHCHGESSMPCEIYVFSSRGAQKVGVTSYWHGRRSTLSKKAGAPLRVILVIEVPLRPLAFAAERIAHRILRDRAAGDPSLPCPTEWFRASNIDAARAVHHAVGMVMGAAERPWWMRPDASFSPVVKAVDRFMLERAG